MATVESALSKTARPLETEQATHDETLAFDLFKPAIGPVFQLDKLPKTAALLRKVKAEDRETDQYFQGPLETAAPLRN